MNFRVASVQTMIAHLQGVFWDGRQEVGDGLSVTFDDYWFNVRPSSNEPLLRVNIEGISAEAVRTGFERIRACIEDFSG